MERLNGIYLAGAAAVVAMLVSCATASSPSSSHSGGMSRQGQAATAKATEDLMDDILRQSARDTAMRSARSAGIPR